MAIVLRCLLQSCVVSFSMRLLIPYILLAGAIDENGVAISVCLPFPYCVLPWADEACWVRMGRGAYCCKAAFSEWSGSVVGAAVGLTPLLLYFPSFFAVRCIGRCSALHLPSQHAASGFAPQCVVRCAGLLPDVCCLPWGRLACWLSSCYLFSWGR